MRRRGWEIAFLLLRHGGYIAGLLLVMSPGKAAAFLGVHLGLHGLNLGGAFLRRQVLVSRNVTGVG